MKSKPTPSLDELPAYISLKDASAVCKCTERELIRLAEQGVLEAYVSPPESVLVFRIFTNLKALYFRSKPDKTRHLNEMLNVKDVPVLCRKVRFLRLGKDDCKNLYNYGSMSQSIFYSAVGVDCRPSSGHDAILERMDYFCYVLSAKEPMRIVDEDRLPHSALTPKSHRFRKNNIRFLTNQITAIEKEAKKNEADSHETNEHLKPMTDVELLKTLHEATSDRLKLLIEISRKLWHVYPCKHKKYPTRDEVIKTLTLNFEDSSGTEIKQFIPIVTPDFSKVKFADIPTTDDIHFLSDKLRKIIYTSNTFHENSKDRAWIYAELTKKEDRLSGNLAEAGQKIISPTSQLAKSQERSRNRRKATRTLK